MQLPDDLMHTVGPLLDPPKFDPDTYYNILLARTQSGLGDWIMLLDVIRMLNEQYPNIEVYVDDENMPDGFEDFLRRWDVEYQVAHNPDPYAFAYYSGHVVYPAAEACGAHFVAGMVRTLNIRTGLNLQFDPSQMAKFQFRDWPFPLRPGQRRPQYVAVALTNYGSETKRCDPAVRDKVVDDILEHTGVVQLGEPGKLAYLRDRLAYPMPNMPLSDLADIIYWADGVITMETGISHLAGHMGVPCMTYYGTSATFYGNVGYPLQTPVGLAELTRTAGKWAKDRTEAVRWMS